MFDRIMPYLIPILLAGVGIFYFYIDPSVTLWTPKCPWLLLTHTYCPSCGIQRTAYLLLHGEVWRAFLTNPFLVLSVPYAAAAVLGKWYNYKHIFDGLNRVIYHRVTLLSYATLFFAWWIIRNLLGI